MILDVVAALIRSGDRFLICKRPEGKANAGHWEFPGGKIEPGENGRDAIIRECREELAILIEACPSPIAETMRTENGVTIHLMLHEAHIVSGTVSLIEHSDAAWITASETGLYDFCASDRELIRQLF